VNFEFLVHILCIQKSPASFEDASGDVPHMQNISYSAIVGTGRDDVIVKRIPFDVQNGTSMSSYSAGVEVKTTGL